MREGLGSPRFVKRGARLGARAHVLNHHEQSSTSLKHRFNNKSAQWEYDKHDYRS
jgi:hypothetical protein